MQYSKFLPIVTGVIFLGCIACCICFRDIDSSVYISMIGVAGGIFGSSIIFYLKKAQTENTYKIKMSLYRESVDQNIRYKREMMKMKQEYSQEDESDDMENMMDDALSDVKSTVDEAMSDATSPIELQTY